MMEIDDNVSVKSDDTDYLVSVKQYPSFIYGNERLDDTFSLVNRYTSPDTLKGPLILGLDTFETDQDRDLSFDHEVEVPLVTKPLENHNVPSSLQPSPDKISCQIYTSPVYSKSSLLSAEKHSSPLHERNNSMSYQKHSSSLSKGHENGSDFHFSPDILNQQSTPVHSSIDELKASYSDFNFEELDEKVQEGQKIISKLLAEISSKRTPGNESRTSLTTIPGVYSSRNVIATSIDQNVSVTSPKRNELNPTYDQNLSSTPQHQKSLVTTPPDQNFSETSLDQKLCYSLKGATETSGTNHDSDGMYASFHISKSSKHSLDGSSSFLQINAQNQTQEGILQNEIAMLKDKLATLEAEKTKEIIALKERNETRIQSLEVSNIALQKQKNHYVEHISELKVSLAKKNERCMQFQELLHKKSQQINQLISKEDQERTRLQNEVRSLQEKKAMLDKQVGSLEQALNKQVNQIKDLDECFARERQNNLENLRVKEEEIDYLHGTIKKQNESNRTLGERMRIESQEQLEKEQSVKDATVTNLEAACKREKERNFRLQEQFKKNTEELIDKLKKAKSDNVKLRQELDKQKKFQTMYHEANEGISQTQTEEMLSMEQKVIEFEKLRKRLLQEFFEESKKLTIITGTKTVSIQSPGKNQDGLLHAFKELKDQLEAFKTQYSLLVNKGNDSLNQSVKSTENSFTSPPATTSSTKLIRHLRTRVHQLRQENQVLRENLASVENGTTVNSLYTDDLERLQRLLKRASMEHLQLQKAHAQLLHEEEPVSTTDTNQIKAMQKVKKPVCHTKALGPTYQGTEIKKFRFDEKLIPWKVNFPEYQPIEYTSPVVLKQPVWADPLISSSTEQHQLNFNVMDETVDRRSYLGAYDIQEGRPINPIGRTGMTGRGLLGKWGPNHAADPVVTCWLRDSTGNRVMKEEKPVLQFVAIRRKDTGEWAIPGGMVDAGEAISKTLKREFIEEALSSLSGQTNGQGELELRQGVDEFFKKGTEICRGYVDDPRNTDNAWMETIVMNFHDDNGKITDWLALNAGDDAEKVCWLSIDGGLYDLYASHAYFIKKTCELHNAYFPT